MLQRPLEGLEGGLKKHAGGVSVVGRQSAPIASLLNWLPQS